MKIITQVELAKRLGKHVNTIGQWVRMGSVPPPYELWKGPDGRMKIMAPDDEPSAAEAAP